MSVTLRNLKRRARAFNLEHPSFVNDPGQNGAGKPESVSFAPLEEKTFENDAVLECAEIKSALSSKGGRPTLRLIKR